MAVSHLLVGAGKMGGALLAGWLESGIVSPRKIGVFDPSPGPQAVFAIERGAKHFTRLQDIPKSVQTVVLAIKPQLFDRVGSDLAASLQPNVTIISILAGTSLRRLDSAFDGRVVIRAMPNTPAAIGAGISAIYVDPNIPPEKIDIAETLLKPGGEVVKDGCFRFGARLCISSRRGLGGWRARSWLTARCRGQISPPNHYWLRQTA